MSENILRFPTERCRGGTQSLLAQAYRFAAEHPRFAYAGVGRAPGLTTLVFRDRNPGRDGGFSAHIRENGVAHALDEAGAFLAGGRTLQAVLARVARR
ncbi:hypothetical protein [Algihabitans albus]|uniref:hypothetical protein n=1 Tax=Algihabitans albus TaxID=2164067 RepID=UPI000E5C5E3E|nr:hypothetical protein [Algihabitans albus]